MADTKSTLEDLLEPSDTLTRRRKVLVQPPNQVLLTNAEKFEEVQRTLRWTDPNVILNEVKFIYSSNSHKRIPTRTEEHMAVHFSLDGCSAFEDCAEAKAQLQKQKKQSTAEEFIENNELDLLSYAVREDEPHAKNEFNFTDRACQTSTVPVREIGISTQPPAMDQFSTTVNQWKIYDFFLDKLQQERREIEHALSATGTGNVVSNTSSSFTSSISSSRMGTANSNINDGSQRRTGTARGRRQSRASRRGSGGVDEAEAIKAHRTHSSHESSSDLASQKQGTEQNDDAQLSREDIMRCDEMQKALQVLERIVNQNREDDIYTDFRYWEDNSDKFKDAGQGSLLPLWRFTSDRTKQKHITSIAWHPTYPDLFAVAYGSYDFSRQTEGIVYCFSLKNTSYPEYMFNVECGAMCLDWHPQHHALLCVGSYDGSVSVYDVRLSSQSPIFKSTVQTGKHTDPVWQVHWQEEDVSKGLNFFSVSSDGLVANWTLTNTELRMDILMRLEKEDATNQYPAPDALPSSALISTQGDTNHDPKPVAINVKTVDGKIMPTVTGLEAGVCIDFNQHSDHLFIVGTEEGHIHKCSKAYSGQYLQSYDGHDMTVYSLQWNPFHPQMFISCSCDWTVKIWRHDLSEPQLTISLGDTVGDVQWAPYSSTVFAAVTNDGFVHVFDLEVNRHEPICKQKVVKRSKLTKLRFANKDAVILIGDENGNVTSLKLSPNLRRNMVESNGVYEKNVERRRLDKALRVGLLITS